MVSNEDALNASWPWGRGKAPVYSLTVVTSLTQLPILHRDIKYALQERDGQGFN